MAATTATPTVDAALGARLDGYVDPIGAVAADGTA